jgi:hypothetical protein
MDNNKLIKYSEYIFSGVFFTGIFIFFAFFYNNHLHFEEQFQLFLLTCDYFILKLGYPGGFSGWTGEFLTQFYYLSLAGPFLITGMLFALQQVIKRILKKVNSGNLLFPFSFIPSLLSGMILCNEFYPFSAIIGFLLAMVAGLVYVTIRREKIRFMAGLILIPLTYWLSGGSFVSLLLLMLFFEYLCYLSSRKNAGNKIEKSTVYGLKWWHFISYVILASVFPLLVRQYLIPQPLMMTFMGEFYYNIINSIPKAVLVLFLLPPLLLLVYFISLKEKQVKRFLVFQIVVFSVLSWLGFKNFANFEAEEIMTYDYLARNERWNEIVRYSENKPPGNYLSLAMLNLSLAKTGQLGNRMFYYDQHGVDGLFLPFNREYVTAIMGSEILYHLGLTNASQEYAFESMETIPNMGKSARVLKRLAETNLINGQYKVSEKYLNILKKTVFYRKWAENIITLLNNEEKINQNAGWAEKRKFAVRNDYFFHIKDIEAVLNRMISEHPGNKIAFEYLMAFYMINKDMGNITRLIPVMEKMEYSRVPVSYQEAVMYIVGLNNEDPFINSPQYVSQDTRRRMKAYADIYSGYPDAGERLQKRFAGTYWFYIHFKEVEFSSHEEKKNNTGST